MAGYNRENPGVLKVLKEKTNYLSQYAKPISFTKSAGEQVHVKDPPTEDTF